MAASVDGDIPALSVAGHETRYALPHGGPLVGERMENVVDNVPVPVVVMSALAEIPLHETATDWLTGAGRATVGWPLALLHSRTVPGDEWSNPDPVTVTVVPPFRQVPGVAVRLGDPVDVVAFALHGTVVVVVLEGAVVVVVVVVVDEVVVVVVVAGVVEKVMFCITSSPAWSPNAM